MCLNLKFVCCFLHLAMCYKMKCGMWVLILVIPGTKTRFLNLVSIVMDTIENQKLAVCCSVNVRTVAGKRKSAASRSMPSIILTEDLIVSDW